MKRRELFRRTLAGALGTAAVAVLPGRGAPGAERKFPEGHDASRELARPDWKPVFLDAHQNETLIALSERIIPATDTPGAREALVNRFIDRLLAAESRQTQQDFLSSLSYLDGECFKRYGAAFVHLPEESQIEILKFLAYPHNLVTWGDNRSEFPGHVHFRNLKGWITRNYYNSEIGMKELGWTGNVFHGDYEGCPHPDKTHK